METRTCCPVRSLLKTALSAVCVGSGRGGGILPVDIYTGKSGAHG
jgi:hypothetical protein